MMHSASAEEESLGLLADFVSEITHALNSLGGKSPKSLVGKYEFWSCKHLHRAADGFVSLRRAGRVDASKLLVRPAIEIFFRLEAVRKNPGLLYRIAFSERLEDEKLLREAQRSEAYDQAQSKENWETFRQNRERFRDAFTAEFAKIPKVDKKLTIASTAENAGLTSFYGGHYMALCASAALNSLVSLGAESPNRDQLFLRLPKPE